MLTAKVRDYIEHHALLAFQDRVVVGVSGGPDSVAMLHILVRLKPEYDLCLYAVHLNHMLRGEAAAADAAYVAELCRDLGVPLFAEARDVGQLARDYGVSVETAGRMVRYDYFRAVAARVGATKIAVGHNADDQAETVLMRLLRGAGVEGLKGMDPKRPDGLIRPLLGVTRGEIEEYCKGHGLHPRRDVSNLERCYLRNRIRLDLLPLLEHQYNPRIKETLTRLATVMTDEHAVMERIAEAAFASTIRPHSRDVLLDLAAMAGEAPAIRRRMIRKGIEKLLGSLTGFSFAHIETILELVGDRPAGSRIMLPRGVQAVKEYNALRLTREPSGPPSPALPPEGIPLTVPGVNFVPALDVRIAASVNDCAGDSIREPLLRQVTVDYDALCLPLVVRTRLPGDRYRPRGFNGSKKLHDLFIDAKVPRYLRDRIPIIADQEGIVWVAGQRPAERVKITGETRRCLTMTVEPLEQEESEHDDG